MSYECYSEAPSAGERYDSHWRQWTEPPTVPQQAHRPVPPAMTTGGTFAPTTPLPQSVSFLNTAPELGGISATAAPPASRATGFHHRSDQFDDSSPQILAQPSLAGGLNAQRLADPATYLDGPANYAAAAPAAQRLPQVGRESNRLRPASALARPSRPTSALVRPTSAITGLTSSYRVPVDQRPPANAKPETPSGARQHMTAVTALAFSQEPERLADSVMALKRERNGLREEKQLLLVNKRRLEGVVARLLGLAGVDVQLGSLEGWGPEGGGVLEGGAWAQEGVGRTSPGAGKGKQRGGNTTQAKMMKVLDESRALDQRLYSSVNGSSAGAAAVAGVLGLAAAEAKLEELQERLSKVTAERDHLVGRLEGELLYRRTQAAAVATRVKKQLEAADDEIESARRRATAAEKEAAEARQHGEAAEKEIVELRKQVAEKEEELVETRGRMGPAEETATEARRFMEVAAAEVAEERRRAEVAQKAAAQVKKELAQVRKQVVTAQGETEAAWQRAVVAEGEAEEARQQEAAAKQEVVEARKESGRLRQQVDDLKKQLDYQVGVLQSRVESLTTTLEKAQEWVAQDAEGSIRELRKQLAASERTVTAQAAQLAELERTVLERDNTIAEFTVREAAAWALVVDAERAAEVAEVKTAEEETARAAVTAVRLRVDTCMAMDEQAAAAALEVAACEAEEVGIEAAVAEAEAEAEAAAAEAAAAAVFAALAGARETAAEEAAAAAIEVAGGEAAALSVMQLLTELAAAWLAAEEAARQEEVAAAWAAAEVADSRAQAMAVAAAKATAATKEEAQEAVRVAEDRAAEAAARAGVAESRVVALEGELVAVGSRAAEAEATAAELEAQLAAARGAAEAQLAEARATAEAQLAEAASALEERTKELRKTEQELEAARKELVAAVEAALASGKKAAEDVVRLGRIVGQLQNELAVKTEKVTELELKVMVLQQENHQLQTTLGRRKGFC